MDPCENFYDFVCGSEAGGLQEGLASVDVLNLDAFAKDSTPADLISSKVLEAYTACLSNSPDKHTMDIHDRLRGAGLVPKSDIFDWRFFLYRARKNGLKYNMLFNFIVEEESSNVTLLVSTHSML